jgi:diguanylate cyclase (GGDEF)-like protein
MMTRRPRSSSTVVLPTLLSMEDATPLPSRALGSLYVSGAVIGLVSLLLPHPPRADLPGLYSNVALAFAGGMVLVLGASRIRPWMIHVALVAGSVLITRAVLLSGETPSFYSIWYLWVGLYSFYFLGRAAAAAHVALVAGLYALTLANNTPNSPIARWLTTMATLVVAGIFIDTLVSRARRQAGAVAASASSMARVAALAHELAALSESTAGRLALCEGAARATRAAHAALWEPGPDFNRLGMTGRSGLSADQEPPQSWPPAGATRAFGSRQAVVDRLSGPSRGERREAGLAAWVWQPIVHEERAIAVLELAWIDPAGLEDPHTAALLNLLAVEVAVTLQRLGLLAELEAKARTDELTGLPNRRWWQEQLPLELGRSGRRAEPLSVAILDLDHFKRYNDAHGHQTGDGLLRQVATAWRAELRPSDLLARHGGEEFTLALPACPPEEAIAVIDRLRSVIPDGQSSSAGIACWDGTEGVAELLARADRALYRAKRDGRNRSAMAADPAPVRFGLSPATQARSV